MSNNFRKNFTLEDRKKESSRIRTKYPERIPVIVERMESSNAPVIDKHKYLVPRDLTLGQFAFVIRKRLSLSPEHAIYIFINNSIHPVSKLMSDIYKEEKEEDDFLYVHYAEEATFG